MCCWQCKKTKPLCWQLVSRRCQGWAQPMGQMPTTAIVCTILSLLVTSQLDVSFRRRAKLLQQRVSERMPSTTLLYRYIIDATSRAENIRTILVLKVGFALQVVSTRASLMHAVHGALHIFIHHQHRSQWSHPIPSPSAIYMPMHQHQVPQHLHLRSLRLLYACTAALFHCA